MTTQFRPKGSTGPPYAPQRDIAYFWMPAIQEAMHGLAHSKLYNNGEYGNGEPVTKEQMATAAELLVAAIETFPETKTVKDPYAALEAVGFWEIPPAVRVMLFARIGEVLMGGFFMGVRDVTTFEERPPDSVGWEEALAAGRAVAAHLAGEYTHEPALELQAAKEAWEARAVKHGARVLKLESQLRGVTADARQAQKEVMRLHAMGLWGRIKEWLKQRIGRRAKR